MGLKFDEICIDARDATALGRWWSQVLDWPHDLDDGQAEANETFVVTLSGPAHCTLGSHNPTVIWITDDDASGVYLPLVLRDSGP